MGTELANAQLAAALATGKRIFSQGKLSSFGVSPTRDSFLFVNGVFYQPSEAFVTTSGSELPPVSSSSPRSRYGLLSLSSAERQGLLSEFRAPPSSPRLGRSP